MSRLHLTDPIKKIVETVSSHNMANIIMFLVLYLCAITYRFTDAGIYKLIPMILFAMGHRGSDKYYMIALMAIIGDIALMYDNYAIGIAAFSNLILSLVEDSMIEESIKHPYLTPGNILILRIINVIVYIICPSLFIPPFIGFIFYALISILAWLCYNIYSTNKNDDRLDSLNGHDQPGAVRISYIKIGLFLLALSDVQVLINMILDKKSIISLFTYYLSMWFVYLAYNITKDDNISVSSTYPCAKKSS